MIAGHLAVQGNLATRPGGRRRIGRGGWSLLRCFPPGYIGHVSVPGIPARGCPYPGHVRVAPPNLWGLRGAWDERRSVPVNGFGELCPDLVTFQEPIRIKGYDQVADLLGPDFYVVHPRAGAAYDRASYGDNHSAVIASRWPFVEVCEVDLHFTPRTQEVPCTTLVAEILAPEPLG